MLMLNQLKSQLKNQLNLNRRLREKKKKNLIKRRLLSNRIFNGTSE